MTYSSNKIEAWYMYSQRNEYHKKDAANEALYVLARRVFFEAWHLAILSES